MAHSHSRLLPPQSSNTTVPAPSRVPQPHDRAHPALGPKMYERTTAGCDASVSTPPSRSPTTTLLPPRPGRMNAPGTPPLRPSRAPPPQHTAAVWPLPAQPIAAILDPTSRTPPHPVYTTKYGLSAPCAAAEIHLPRRPITSTRQRVHAERRLLNATCRDSQDDPLSTCCYPRTGDDGNVVFSYEVLLFFMVYLVYIFPY